MQQNPIALINWRLVWSVLVSAFVAGVAGAYPFLDPAQFNWRGALAAFLLAFVGAIAYQITHTNTQNRLKSIETKIVDGSIENIRQTRSVQGDDPYQFHDSR